MMLDVEEDQSESFTKVPYSTVLYYCTHFWFNNSTLN